MTSPLAALKGPKRPERVFLFLQGPSSPIFRKIAAILEENGHVCHRINLNAGDWIFWRRRNGHNFRGRSGAWAAHLSTFVKAHGVTDLVLLGEERPCHRTAVAVAREHAISVFVVEMGYLRPDWLTLECDGMSSNSHFPNDPSVILNAAHGLPEPDWSRRYSQTFLTEAAYDLLYNLPNVFLWFLFPHYQRHALYHPLAEYGGWLVRLSGAKRRRRAADALVAALADNAAPVFVYPLQLQTDYQLRAHSPYNSQQEAIAEVLHSFAAHAAAQARLVVKLHPLDNGLFSWNRVIADHAQALGVSDRVYFIDGGDLATLLERCAGVVTVNSTVGLHALQQEKPVKVLGEAIFNTQGLSDQQPLDMFWRNPAAPDAFLVAAFFRLVAAAIQVRGNFYSAAGTSGGAQAIARRLLDNSVNQPGAFVDPPPRRKPAKRPVQRQ